MASLSLQLPEEVSKQLEELARRTGRSESSIILEALQEHLENLEDLYLAEQALEDIRAGRSKTHPLEEVMKEYGLDD